MTKTHRRTTDERFCTSAPEPLSADESRAASERGALTLEMRELGIAQDGPGYVYNGYRYDRLADALAYARLIASRPLRRDAGGTAVPGCAVAPPGRAEEALMAPLGIVFSDGHYRFESYRYDHLADAMNYARLVRGRCAAAAA